MRPSSDVRAIIESMMETTVWMGANDHIHLQTHANAELGVWDPINDALNPLDRAAHNACSEAVAWWNGEW